MLLVFTKIYFKKSFKLISGVRFTVYMLQKMHRSAETKCKSAKFFKCKQKNVGNVFLCKVIHDAI